MNTNTKLNFLLLNKADFHIATSLPYTHSIRQLKNGKLLIQVKISETISDTDLVKNIIDFYGKHNVVITHVNDSAPFIVVSEIFSNAESKMFSQVVKIQEVDDKVLEIAWRRKIENLLLQILSLSKSIPKKLDKHLLEELRTEHVSELTGYSPDYLYRIPKSELLYVKRGKYRYYQRKDVLDWISEKHREGIIQDALLQVAEQ